MELTETQRLIAQVCEGVKNILLEKNRKYGDSAVNPKRIFSKADPIEQINVRLDDKMSRIMSGQQDEDEDVELDIIGYLVLKRVARAVHAKQLKPESIRAINEFTRLMADNRPNQISTEEVSQYDTGA